MNQRIFLTFFLLLFASTLYAQVSFTKGYPNNEFVRYLPSTPLVSFETDDGGYMLIANMIEDLEVDGVLIKVDENGEVQWNKRFGKPGVTDKVVSGLQNSDGEYIISTTFDPVSTIYDEEVNFWRFDRNGKLIIETNITYSGICCWDIAVGKIIQTSDGNYIFPYKSFGISTVYTGIIKVDKSGKQIWADAIRTNAGIVSDVHESGNGDILISDGGGNGFIRKLDANGNVLLHEEFGLPLTAAHSSNLISSIVEQPDGYLFPVCYADENSSKTWLVKTDFKLDTLWTKVLPEIGFIYGMAQNNFGNLILIGSDGYHVNTFILDDNFNIQGPRILGKLNSGSQFKYFNKASDGTLIISGATYFGSTLLELLLVKLDDNACVKPIADFLIEQEPDQTEIKISYLSDVSRYYMLDSELYSFQWDVGDGTTSIERDVLLHPYEKQDNYIVTHVADNGCRKDTVRKSVNAACFGEPNKFNSTTTLLDVLFSYNPKSTFWNWDFGDGSRASGKVVKHHYKVPGIYKACLTTDNACGQIRLCDSVKVDCPLPVLNLKKEMIACGGSLLTLDATSPGCTYLWSTNETSSKIKVGSAGNYWVDAKSLGGAVTRDTVNVTFVTPPVIALTELYQVCQGEDLILKYPNPDNYTFSWYINNSLVASGNEFTYKCIYPGNYKLKVEIGKGDCLISKSATLIVNEIQICKPHCVPAYTTGTSTGNFIKTVVFNTINNNNSGSVSGPYYTNYSNKFQTNLVGGKRYDLTLAFDLKGSLYYGVWIDFNQDGRFDETTERITSGNALPTTYTLNFGLRSGIPLGPTVMRVRLMDATSLSEVNPCSPANVGETEDYKVVIVPDCPDISLKGTVVHESCGGGNGAIDVTVSGGAFPYTYLWNNGAKVQDLKGIGLGTYSVTATDVNGCSTTNSWYVGAIKMFSVGDYALSSTDYLCNGSIEMIVSSKDQVTFNWDHWLPSSNKQFGLCPGSYKVTMKNQDGCVIVKTIDVGVRVVTSMESPETINMLEIYPNPFSDDILNFEVMADEEDAKLSLRTLSGVPVVEDENISLKSGLNKMTFSTGSIKPGVYILSITTSKGSTHRRIIKK